MAGIGAQLSILHAAGMSEFAPEGTLPAQSGNGKLGWGADVAYKLVPAKM